MNNPLSVWYCDVCGEVIDDVEKGYVIWQTDENLDAYNFKIIHQRDCDLKNHPSSSALEDFLGVRGATYLMTFLSLGPIKKRMDGDSSCRVKNLNDFVDFFRRVQIPYYEEARRRFGDANLLARLSDANELYPYLPDVLEKIAKE